MIYSLGHKHINGIYFGTTFHRDHRSCIFYLLCLPERKSVLSVEWTPISKCPRTESRTELPAGKEQALPMLRELSQCQQECARACRSGAWDSVEGQMERVRNQEGGLACADGLPKLNLPKHFLPTHKISCNSNPVTNDPEITKGGQLTGSPEKAPKTGRALPCLPCHFPRASPGAPSEPSQPQRLKRCWQDGSVGKGPGC